MRLSLYLVFLLFPVLLYAQVTPREGAALNYRLIGFSFTAAGNAMLEIAKGTYNDVDSFRKNIILSQPCTTNRIIATVPEFGTAYTWRVRANKKTELHHFSTLLYEYADTNKARMRIINNYGCYNDHFVFVDRSMTMYEMQGSPLWFIPATGNQGSKGGLRDIKLTSRGTVTFIVNDDVQEVDYNGKKLWQGPNDGKASGDTSELYHHEFTRLASGHYMVLGTQHTALPVPYYKPGTAPDSAKGIFKDKDGNYQQKLEFGTVLEYDREGHLIWSWKSVDYYKTTELFDHYLADGSLPSLDVHENAFYFDEKRKELYVGFKNISRIVKIKYPEGNVTATYGIKDPNGTPMLCSKEYCGQHSIRLSSAGELMVSDNNSSSFSNMPRAVLLKENKENTALEITWSFDCNFDGLEKNEVAALYQKDRQMQHMYTPDKLTTLAMNVSPGGNFSELPGSCFFISTGGRFGKMIIVNQEKRELWSAILELKIFDGAPWTSQATYRASIISRQQLEQFIWAAQ